MPSPRFAICLFCDDVRSEIGNKVSLMGIYAGEMVFPIPPPVTMTRFFAVVYLLCEAGDAPERLVTRITVPPGETELVRVASERTTIPFPQPDWATRFMITQIVPIMHLVVPEEGLIQVHVETEREVLLAGRLKVGFAPPPAPISTTDGAPTA